MKLFDEFDSEEMEESGKIYGVVVGVVSNNKDDEGLGRVKVDFPWRSEDNDESHWARAATLMAGNGRGSFFIPELGDEVLVAFEHGNVEHPVIIGSLWNGKDKPPETNSDGKNNIRKIKSRSGHEIIFNDDKEGKKEKLEINSKSGHRIVLDDSGGQEKIEIVDKTGSNRLTIDSTKKAINIESGMQLNIKAAKVEIEGSTSLTIKSSGVLTIQGSMVKIN